MKNVLKMALTLLLTSNAFAQINERFNKGAREFGISNIGIGYSSSHGLMISASTRYQYYFLNRFSAGGVAFYDQFGSTEWMGLGPVASYILFTHSNWFGRLDQHLIAAKYNGFRGDYASVYGTSGLSLNYLPTNSNYYIGGGYAHSYALSDGDVLRPNIFQLGIGWFFN